MVVVLYPMPVSTNTRGVYFFDVSLAFRSVLLGKCNVICRSLSGKQMPHGPNAPRCNVLWTSVVSSCWCVGFGGGFGGGWLVSVGFLCSFSFLFVPCGTAWNVFVWYTERELTDMRRKMDNMVSCIEQLCYDNGDQTKHLFASLFDSHDGGTAGMVGTPRSGMMSAPSSEMDNISRHGSRSGSNDSSMSDFLFDDFYDEEDVVVGGEGNTAGNL